MHGDAQAAVLHAQRQDQVLAHQVFGDEGGGVGGDLVAVQLHVLHVVLLGQGLKDVGFATQLQVDQGFADPQVLGLGVIEGLVHFLLGDDSPLREDLAQLLLRLGHG